MKLGDWQVDTIVDGTFALDGGAMFGVVPRVLWQRQVAVDERNRVPLASRLLLLRGHERVVLVDTGLGDRWSDKERDIYAVTRRDGGAPEALQRLDVDPAAVTDVILTHLHFDHAAGTVTDGGALQYPNATHHLQSAHWEWALHPTRKDSASFRRPDFAALADSPALQLHDGEVEVAPDLRLRPLDGHTRAMQAVLLSGGGDTLLYAADLVPTAAHLPLPWIMAYDNHPLQTLAEKEELLIRAAREGWIVVFEHDPEQAVARLHLDERGNPAVAEALHA